MNYDPRFAWSIRALFYAARVPTILNYFKKEKYSKYYFTSLFDTKFKQLPVDLHRLIYRYQYDTVVSELNRIITDYEVFVNTYFDSFTSLG